MRAILWLLAGLLASGGAMAAGPVQTTLGAAQANPAGIRSALGLGGAAVLNSGTTTGTVAAGDDSRITGALQRSGGTMTGALAMGANQISGSLFAVTGGSIDGTPIGSTAPSTGAFLSASAGGTVIDTAGRVSFTNTAHSMANGASLSIPNVAGLSQSGINLYQTVAISKALSAPVLNFNANNVWSGTAAQGQMVSNNTWTGTNSGSNPAVLHSFLQSNVQVTNSGSAGIFGIYDYLNLNSANASGPVVDIEGTVAVNATTGNASGAAYVGGSFIAIASANDHGTVGNPLSGLSGINPVMKLLSGATYWAGAGAQEDDCSVATGASVTDFVCSQIVLLSTHAVSGTRDDLLFSMNSQTAANTATYGIVFGRKGGNFPISSSGTMIWGTNGGSGFSTANGIDWSLGTFSGNTWNDGHTKLTGAGEIVAAKITDPASAPGAGALKLTVVAGTTGGTCKLIARAGTSTTPITIVDNVGTGC